MSLFLTPMWPRIVSKARFLLFAFWWGAMGTVGAVVVPLLFKTLPVKALAGVVAAQLFIWTSELSVLCAGVTLICFLWVAYRAPKVKDAPLEDPSNKGLRSKAQLSLLVLVASLTMLFLIIPKIQMGEDRALWHALGSAVFVLQWVLSAVLLLVEGKRCFGPS